MPMLGQSESWRRIAGEIAPIFPQLPMTLCMSHVIVVNVVADFPKKCALIWGIK